ncbi:flagellar assembly protein FliH [Spirochaetota bacterium]
MPDKLIKADNTNVKKEKIFIEPPTFKQLEEIEAVEEVYDGPSIEEVEQEISEKKQRANEEALLMKREAEEEAKRIIDLAESGAFQRIKEGNQKHKEEIEKTRREAEEIVKKARDQAEHILKDVETKRAEINRQASEEGFQKGFDDSFEKGRDELERIKERLEKILGETINKRNEIIESSEKQLINIAIAMAKKVVKAITESDQAVILRNVTEALRKVKGRARVTIRVNINDLELTTRHKDDFYRMLDNIENVNVLEDPNIEQGGCIIETDFGDIDARVSTQLNEIETAIREIMPIKGF